MSDETLFATALEQPDPAARAAFLDSTCPDADTRRRLDALLAAHDKAGDFLARPAVALPTPETSPTRAYAPEADHTRTHGGTIETDTDDALGFLATPRRPDSLGRIGHYEVLEVLGRGGFGIVFRAFDETLQRVVAVKVLAPSMAATSPARKRFLREARHAGNVRHDNVVQIHDISRDEERLPYLVMEFIPGETLQERLDRTGPLEVAEVLRIGKQIAAGLASAHEMNLVHRDIKPSNILIDSGPEQRVKITDFGLARAADDASISQSGVVAGTPMYMAPEQAKGEALDHRADLFSLGSVLYVMCSGRPPFRAGSTLAVLKRVCEEQPRPIREIIPEVPDWLCRIIDKLHAKDPAERFHSADEVATLLQQHLDHMQHPDRVPLPEPVQGLRSSAVQAESTRQFEQASSLLIGLVMLALLVGAVISTAEYFLPGSGMWVGAGLFGLGLAVELFKRTTSQGPPQWKGFLHPTSGLLMLSGIPGFVFGLLLRSGTPVQPLLPIVLGGGFVVLFGLFLLTRFAVAHGSAATASEASRPRSPRSAVAPESPAMWVGVAAGVAIVLFALIGVSIIGSLVAPAIAPEFYEKYSQSVDGALVFGGVAVLLAVSTAVLTRRRIAARTAENPAATIALALARARARNHRMRWIWPAAALSLLVVLGGLFFGRAAVLYATNRGEMEIAAIEGFNSVIVLRNDRGVDEDVLLPMVTDWMGMERGRTLKLPPGTYQLNAGIGPDPGRKVTHWKVMHSGTFGSRTEMLPGLGHMGWSVIVTVERGERLSLWPVPEDLAAVEKRNRDAIDPSKLDAIGQAVHSTHPTAFTPLFNGMDLTGWKTHPKHADRTWEVKNGILSMKGPDLGYLFTVRDDFTDFRLRIEAKCTGNTPGSVGLRAPFEIEDWGGVKCVGNGLGHAAGMAFLGFRNSTRSKSPPVPLDTWFTQEWALMGNVLTVKLNGEEIATYTDVPEEFKKGHLLLASPPGEIQFRKIEIMESPPSAPSHGQPIAGWGTIVDPKRAGKFDASADGLTITVPAGKYNLNPTPEFNNLDAPRVLRSAAGDFHLEARVDAFPPPRAGPPGVRDNYVAAGIVIWKDERNFVRFVRAANGETSRVFVHFEVFRDGRLLASNGLDQSNRPIALRASRTGETLRFAWSADGATWRDYPVHVPISLAGNLEVGVCAINTTEHPFAARFTSPQFRSATDAFVPLFNSKDLTGWKTFPEDTAGTWTISDGYLQGKLTPGKEDSQLVWTGGVYRDFHLRAEVRTGDGGFGGILFRWDFPKMNLSSRPEAYDAVINNNSPIKTRTGSLFHLGSGKAIKDRLVMPNIWFTYEVIAQGDEIELRVNGQTTVKHVDLQQLFRGGHIALDFADPEGTIQFRKIEIKELPPGPPAPEWSPLFNGKDTTGWSGKFPNAWSVDDGILIGRGKNGSEVGWSELVHPRGDFQDFHLRAQARINATGWAGIRVRKQKDSQKGYKIWLSNDPDKTGAKTGRLDVEGGPDKLLIANPPDDLRMPVDEWFTIELIARGPELVLSINGKEAARVNDASFARGEIQLEVAGADTVVQFRKIEIQELPPREQWVQLFNGKDLTEWKSIPKATSKATWDVRDGVLVAKGGVDLLYSPRDHYENLHFRAEVQVRKGSCNLCFRMPAARYDGGYSVRAARLPSDFLAGHLILFGKGQPATLTTGKHRFKPDEWLTLEVIADGNRLRTFVNGELDSDFVDEQHTYQRGYVGLRLGQADNEVHFRKIEIKELTVAPAAPALTDLDRADLAKLKGEWDAHKRMFDGKSELLGSDKNAGIRFGDGDFELWLTEGKKTDRQSGSFRVEAANKQVLLYFKDQQVPVRVGYRVEGDTLQLNFAGLVDTDGNAKGPPLRIQERMTSRNNLQGIAIAMHSYADLHKGLPQAAISSAKDGKPLLSWRVALLPYIGDNNLFKQFKLDEPWDSEHNKKLIEKMPRVFAAPGIATPQPGMTHYRVFAGPGTVFEPRPGKEHGFGLNEILDGTANTLLVVEAADPVIWTKPDDLAFDPKKPLPKLGIYERATHIAMCDGKILALAPGAAEETIRALATRNGGEMVSAPVLAPEPPQAPPLSFELRRRGSLPDGAVVLRAFDPAKDKAVPVRGNAKEIVSVEDGAWRIENAFDSSVSGNFRVAIGTITDGIPEDGIIIYRAKIKLKPSAKNGGWGDLELNAASPSFHGYDWPDHLGEYRGEITEWTQKEVRYPVEIIRKKYPPTVTLHVGLHGNGVLWVKDVELLHLPAPAKPAVIQPLRDLVASTSKSRDLVKARFDAGTASKIDLAAAEAGLVEARIRLAEAEGARAEVIALHGVLVAQRQEERDLIAQRVNIGVDAPDLLAKADARLADAKVRLAKVKPPAPAAPAPRPRP